MKSSYALAVHCSFNVLLVFYSVEEATLLWTFLFLLLIFFLSASHLIVASVVTRDPIGILAPEIKCFLIF